MIRVTVELVPFGRDEYAKRIGTLLIANDGTGSVDVSDYVWVARDDMSGHHEGRVSGHDRQSNIWQLIAKCLPGSTREG